MAVSELLKRVLHPPKPKPYSEFEYKVYSANRIMDPHLPAEFWLLGDPPEKLWPMEERFQLEHPGLLEALAHPISDLDKVLAIKAKQKAKAEKRPPEMEEEEETQTHEEEEVPKATDPFEELKFHPTTLGLEMKGPDVTPTPDGSILVWQADPSSEFLNSWSKLETRKEMKAEGWEFKQSRGRKWIVMLERKELDR